jgi:hypothetical protein
MEREEMGGLTEQSSCAFRHCLTSDVPGVHAAPRRALSNVKDRILLEPPALQALSLVWDHTVNWIVPWRFRPVSSPCIRQHVVEYQSGLLRVSPPMTAMSSFLKSLHEI